MFTTEMFILMGEGLLETLYMTLVAAAVSYVLGLPLGLVLVVTDADGIRPNAAVNRILGTIINALRSVPFLILLFTVIPVTRFITGTTIGPTATIVPLTIAAAPFIARMVESSVKEVDRGVIEASLSMGASTLQIVWHVLLPEAKPSLISGSIISTVTILSYTALAATLGGTGLGQVAIIYGHQRSQKLVVWVCVFLIVIIVQVIQIVGTRILRRTDKRAR